MGKELEQWRALRRLRGTELAEEENKTEHSLVSLHQARVRRRVGCAPGGSGCVVRADQTARRSAPGVHAVLTRRPCASQELAAVDNQIKEKRAQIRFSKAALVNNDAAIQRLLQQVVMTR